MSYCGSRYRRRPLDWRLVPVQTVQRITWPSGYFERQRVVQSRDRVRSTVLLFLWSLLHQIWIYFGGPKSASGHLTDTLFDEGFDAFVGRLQERPLREHIGHTPVQVVAGAVTGIVIGIAVSFSVVGVE